MSTNQNLYCGSCGFYLGSGIAGGIADCLRCGEFVVTKAQQGKSSEAFGGLLLLGLGILFGLALFGTKRK